MSDGMSAVEDLDHEAFRARLADTAELIDGAQIICGIPSFNNERTVANVVRAVEAGLRRSFPDIPAAIVVSDGHSEDATIEVGLEATTKGDEEYLLISERAPLPKRIAIRYAGISGKGSAFRTIFTIAELIGARACAVFDSDLRSIGPEWVEHLIAPVLQHGQDHVTPIYARHKFDGTITNAIAFPLTAALYGKRVRQPIGGEFGFSGALASFWANQEVWSTDVARYGIDIWMTTTALSEGFQVCQALLGAKIHDPKDPGLHLAPMFRQVVGSLFALAGRHAGRWYDVEAIEPVPTYGFRTAVSPEEIRIRSGRLTWRFIEGYLRYEPVWRDVLSPHTLGGVTRASDEAGDKTEGFVLPAELWAHIVYDYMVAFNQAEVDVSLLLDSMIPLYFARTATFVHEASSDDHDQAEDRISAFADLFLERKPYLRDRWDEVGQKRSLAEQTVTPHGDEHEGMTEGELGSQTV